MGERVARGVGGGGVTPAISSPPADRTGFGPGLLNRLSETVPPVRGRLTADADLSKVTWFRVGGPAEVMFRPEDADDLAAFLAALPADVPVTVLGVASNTLVRDGGIPGVTVRLGRGFAGVTRDGDRLTFGAAMLDANAARHAAEAGLTGLEFLVGIPGTIGGGCRMNAGAYGTEFKDVAVAVEAVDRTGTRHRLDAAAMGWSYRHSDLPADWIVTAATLVGRPGDADEIARRMTEISTARADSQPVNSPTGGSTFANPDGGKAWQLIDSVGGRGLTVGGATVSEKHCNFLINTGTATASDIEALGEELRRRVREAHGIELRWEIRRVGLPLGNGEAPA